jgi:LacI family transcriptional regulator
MVKRATALEVAKRAGVSRTTVSFVLNDVPGMRISPETRQRVVEAARELDYHPNAAARHMVTGRASAIGFIMRQRSDQVFADHFLPQVLLGLNQAALRKNYHTLIDLIPPGDHSTSYTSILSEHHVDGIVVSGPLSQDEELIRIHAQGAPVVLLGQFPNSDIPSIDVDNMRGASLATRHLLDLGHRRIALITNSSLDYTAASDRLDGYRQTLASAGISYDPDIVRYGNFTPASGFETMESLLASPRRPTAVFIASDTVALGALQAAHLYGLRVPEDLAVVGFDDIPLAEFIEPALTTVRLPAQALGYGAAEQLIQLIEGRQTRGNRKVLLNTELIVRQSCGAIPDWPGRPR